MSLVNQLFRQANLSVKFYHHNSRYNKYNHVERGDKSYSALIPCYFKFGLF